MKKSMILSLIVVLIVLAGGFWIFSQKSTYTAPIPNPESQTVSDNSTVQQPESNSTAAVQPTKTYEMEIQGFDYSPQEMTINVGDTLVWTNLDSATHTVTSDSGTELNSGYLGFNGKYTHIFTTAGTFKYHCKLHPGMKATVTVK